MEPLLKAEIVLADSQPPVQFLADIETQLPLRSSPSCPLAVTSSTGSDSWVCQLSHLAVDEGLTQTCPACLLCKNGECASFVLSSFL